MNGLEFLHEMAARDTNYPPIGRMVGFRLIEIDYGKILVGGRATAAHYNPLGVVHGGFSSTLLDLALGHVSISVLPDMNYIVTTTDLSVKYIRPIFETTGAMTCEAHVVHRGKTLVVAEGRLFGEDQKLYGLAYSTCLIVARM